MLQLGREGIDSLIRIPKSLVLIIPGCYITVFVLVPVVFRNPDLGMKLFERLGCDIDGLFRSERTFSSFFGGGIGRSLSQGHDGRSSTNRIIVPLFSYTAWEWHDSVALGLYHHHYPKVFILLLVSYRQYLTGYRLRDVWFVIGDDHRAFFVNVVHVILSLLCTMRYGIHTPTNEL